MLYSCSFIIDPRYRKKVDNDKFEVLGNNKAEIRGCNLLSF